MYIHIKGHTKKSILLLVKFIAYIYPYPFYLVFFLQALLVPFPGLHFRSFFFLMLLHFYQKPHIITWTSSLFFVVYLLVHADLFSAQISAVLWAFCTPPSTPFLPFFFFFFSFSKSLVCFFSTREPHYRNTEITNRTELCELFYSKMYTRHILGKSRPNDTLRKRQDF